MCEARARFQDAGSPWTVGKTALRHLKSKIKLKQNKTPQITAKPFFENKLISRNKRHLEPNRMKNLRDQAGRRGFLVEIQVWQQCFARFGFDRKQFPEGSPGPQRPRAGAPSPVRPGRELPAERSSRRAPKLLLGVFVNTIDV